MLVPRPYQTEAIKRVQRANLLLADQCGLGKTLTAIESVKEALQTSRYPALVVIPKSLRRQWLDALAAQGVTFSQIYVLDAKGLASALEPTKARPVSGALTLADAPFTHAPVILAHYEAVTKHVNELKRFRYSLIVCDEAHRIKNRKAQRTQAIKELKADRRLAMTGTPFDRNPADAWSILNWLEPQFFTSYWRFFNAHVEYTQTKLRTGQIIKTPVGIADYERFSRVLRQYSLRRTKLDVREDMPPNIEQYVNVELDPAQARAYRKIVNASDIGVEFDDVRVDMPIELTRILRLMQVTTDPELLGIKAPSAKLEWVTDWLEDNAEESVIIFTRFRATAEKLAQLITAQERSCKLIIGGTKRPTVTADDKLIIGTIAAMGEGLDLPWIDNAIFIDCEWSSILMTQALDRIHRINITSVKHTYYLQAPGTVDELVYTAVREKLSTAELVARFVRGDHHSASIDVA